MIQYLSHGPALSCPFGGTPPPPPYVKLGLTNLLRLGGPKLTSLLTPFIGRRKTNRRRRGELTIPLLLHADLCCCNIYFKVVFMHSLNTEM